MSNSPSSLFDAKAWHNKVSIQVTLPGLGVLVIDRTPLQARRLAAQLQQSAIDADGFEAQAIEASAEEAAHKIIDKTAARMLGIGPAESRARAAARTQAGSATLACIDLLAAVGVVTLAIGFAVRALAIA